MTTTDVLADSLLFTVVAVVGFIRVVVVRVVVGGVVESTVVGGVVVVEI